MNCSQARDEKGVLARFIEEAQIRLFSPNVVPVHDFGLSDGRRILR